MLFLSTLLALTPATPEADTLKTLEIPRVVVSAPIKHNGDLEDEPVSVSAFDGEFIETNRIEETKDLSLVVPNFLQPDYGSKMTSSIYVRGIGARMDQPSVGLYIDNIPVLNKNDYDIDYFDVSSLYLLRGPQGTLYGRNTIGGVIDMHTLSPLAYQGTRVHAGYGNGNTSEAKVSTYQKLSDNLGVSIALNHMYSDGFFTNQYDGTSADRVLSEGGRLKLAYRFNNRWSMENTFYGNYVKQKGFAYSPYDMQTGAISPINHNDPCNYERVNLTDGLTFRYDGQKLSLSSTTSYQYTDDEMNLDQDFSPASIYTLQQKQKENAVTQEFVLRTKGEGRWQSISGIFGFYKGLDTSSPVTLKQDGIQNYIIAKASQGMPPTMSLLIEEDAIPINSAFELPTFGASAYHQSSFTAGRWKFTAGIRADYEKTEISYNNDASLHYMVAPSPMPFTELPITLGGRESDSFLEFLPQAAVTFNMTAGMVYASASKGYKAGGFNTQMFSDILQNMMMNGLRNRGQAVPAPDVSGTISYKPEYSWNYEVGGHLGLLEDRLHLDMALFYIDLRDQQLTVFPAGQQTGRMMSNAGHSRSMGAELSASYSTKAFDITASYGYTNAKFKDYVMEGKDFSGKYVPYIPQNTVSVIAGYRVFIGQKRADNILFNVGWQGAGKIYWNEANTVSQKFYGTLNASARLNCGKFSYTVWGKNLTDTDYNTFYFRSAGSSFVQRGKPLQFGLSLDIKL